MSLSPGVLRTVSLGDDAVAAPVPPQKIEFHPNYELPEVTAAREAKRHARDIHPEVRAGVEGRRGGQVWRAGVEGRCGGQVWRPALIPI